MKPLVNKKTTKNLIIILILLITLSGLFPNYVQAKTDTNDGGPLLQPLVQFVTFLGDSVMQWLQDTFVSKADIYQGSEEYNFQYSPAIIFSGNVPALDINFIEPNNKMIIDYADDYAKYVKDYAKTYYEDRVSTITDEYTNIINNDKAIPVDCNSFEERGTDVNCEAYYFMENDSLHIAYHYFYEFNEWRLQ